MKKMVLPPPYTTSIFDTMMDDLFGKFADQFKTSRTEFVEVAAASGSPSDTKRWRTSFDNDGGLVLEVDMPGIEPKTISITAEGNNITVYGKRADEDFTQSYAFARNYDVSTVRAKHSLGQLRIYIAASTASSPRGVHIVFE